MQIVLLIVMIGLLALYIKTAGDSVVLHDKYTTTNDQIPGTEAMPENELERYIKIEWMKHGSVILLFILGIIGLFTF